MAYKIITKFPGRDCECGRRKYSECGAVISTSYHNNLKKNIENSLFVPLGSIGLIVFFAEVGEETMPFTSADENAIATIGCRLIEVGSAKK